MANNLAKCLMVQGTSSNAGKSVLVAALCRIFARKGYSVAPFKSQNMSLNSYATEENSEIAMAQALQAEAAGVKPSYHMNPILLKPKGGFISQVIVHGKPVGDMSFDEYQKKFRKKALEAIKESLTYLRKRHDIIIIEGAGSPAEINIQKYDLANMKVAQLADSNVILVADIDRGGVFASIAGTFLLLNKEDRKRIKGIIINKFRGNLDILKPGIKKIEKIVKTPVIGVLPYSEDLRLPEEDSASLAERKYKKKGKIKIGVIHLPKISNFTDVDPLESEPDVSLKFIGLDDSLDKLDAVILPGTRNTAKDLIKIREHGLDEEIIEFSKDSIVFGICGGFQMLGTKIIDKYHKESKFEEVEGLGLLDCKTKFSISSKIISQSKGIVLGGGIFKNMENVVVEGYELHEGTTILKNVRPFIKIIKGHGNLLHGKYDGAVNENVAGTYFHGIFHNPEFRTQFVNILRKKKGLKTNNHMKDYYKQNKKYSLDKLADIVLKHVDINKIEEMLGL